MLIEIEAREMVSKIYQSLGKLRTGIHNDKLLKFSKDTSINIIEHFIKQMPEGSSRWLHQRKIIDEIKRRKPRCRNR